MNDDYHSPGNLLRARQRADLARGERPHEPLAEAGTPHAVIGGVAVCLHGYRRNTVDIDLLVRTEDMPAIRAALTKAGFSWDDKVREFRDPVGIPVQFVAAGERAEKGSEVLLPSPADEHVAVMIEGLPVLSLSALIELKLACGGGTPGACTATSPTWSNSSPCMVSTALSHGICTRPCGPPSGNLSAGFTDHPPAPGVSRRSRRGLVEHVMAASSYRP